MQYIYFLKLKLLLVILLLSEYQLMIPECNTTCCTQQNPCATENGYFLYLDPNQKLKCVDSDCCGLGNIFDKEGNVIDYCYCGKLGTKAGTMDDCYNVPGFFDFDINNFNECVQGKCSDKEKNLLAQSFYYRIYNIDNSLALSFYQDYFNSLTPETQEQENQTQNDNVGKYQNLYYDASELSYEILNQIQSSNAIFNNAGLWVMLDFEAGKRINQDSSEEEQMQNKRNVYLEKYEQLYNSTTNKELTDPAPYLPPAPYQTPIKNRSTLVDPEKLKACALISLSNNFMPECP